MATVPQIGVALCLSGVVLGQQAGAMAIDHHGRTAVARELIGLRQVGGALLIPGGVRLQWKR